MPVWPPDDSGVRDVLPHSSVVRVQPSWLSVTSPTAPLTFTPHYITRIENISPEYTAFPHLNHLHHDVMFC